MSFKPQPPLNDFHKWDAWSPWAKLDPNCKVTFEGPASGKGAGFTWAGNNEVGEGRQTIVESRPSELVRVKLEFLKPIAANNDVEFTFKPEGAMPPRHDPLGSAPCGVRDANAQQSGPGSVSGLA